MTIAFWCVLIAAVMPLMFTGVAKGLGGYGLKSNRDPRAFQAALEGRARRAHNAHLNGFEAFPAFAAAVIIAHLVGNMAQGTMDLLALIFVVARLIYGATYIADLSTLRSLVWTVAYGCMIALFVLSA